MNNIKLLEMLDLDSDAYWVAYDLKLTLGWADTNNVTLPWLRSFSSWAISGHASYSYSDRFEVSHINYTAVSCIGNITHSNGHNHGYNQGL